MKENIRSKLFEMAARHDMLRAELESPSIANDHRRSAQIQREEGKLRAIAKLADELRRLESDRAEAASWAESPDAELAEMGREELARSEARAVELERAVKDALIADEEAERDSVIVEIRAGTGGDEAGLWAGDLFRMYSRYAEAKGWKVELLSSSEGTGGRGFKEVDFRVSGNPEVWRRFRFEAGGHRVQRVPETEAKGRIHTSAATVAVLPEVEDVEIEIREEDLEVDTMRAGGPGGQHQNKTSSAVRMTHKPSGVVVVCREKSQHQNRKEALRMLRAKLFQMEEEKRQREHNQARKSMLGSGDRSQRIRTYNFPQNRVTDHRINEDFSLETVIEGRLEPMTQALIEFDREERLGML
ncbi:MAG: peptide chain release factor 1 [Planctomycetes bacterium]|nr:peptide chain release factor 1 [Planctomycetota bacterium]